MRILVTGSEGFIGKHLCRALVSARHHVVGYDSLNGNDVIMNTEWPDADLVYHLAAQTNAYSDNVMADARQNIIGLLYVLEAYKSKVVFTSSSMINYPVTPYAVSKLAGENYCKLYGASVVRLCNIYGEGGHSVVDKFAASKNIVIHGDGHQLRTYAPVQSAVDLLLEELVERKPLRVLSGLDMSVLAVARAYKDKPYSFAPQHPLDLADARQL